MNVYSERSRSVWMETEPPSAPVLEANTTADVVVVGSGIAGLSTAYELAKAGRKVIVLDRGPIARGMTARTTAHLTSGCDDYFSELIKRRGRETAIAFHQSQAAAIDRIASIAAEEDIACDFARVDGYLFAAREEDERTLDAELEAARDVGFAGIEKVPAPPFRGLSPYSCLVYPRQGRFHPTRYLDGLVEAILQLGGRVHGATTVVKVEESDQTADVRVATASGPVVSAEAAVVATNSPIAVGGPIHAMQAPYRTYALAVSIPSVGVADALFWDTADPYHYVRRQPLGSGDVLIVGGEDHKSGEANDMAARLARLESWGRERFPMMGDVGWRWSGQCLEPADHLGFIGKAPGKDRIYVITGDSGQGITTGVVGGMIVADLVQGAPNPWAKAYDPSRKPVRALTEIVAENVTAVKELLGHLTPGEIRAEEDLRPGEGGLIRMGGKKLAVSRDANGVVHRHAAACSHLGCTVHWNPFEQCWDCPCHGSQFAPDGTAINAPAVDALSPAPAPVEAER